MIKKIANAIYFSSLRTAALFHMELEGQISDGKYENTRPFEHWRFLQEMETYMADDTHKPGYYTVQWYQPRLKTYNLDEWPKWIANKNGKWNNYEWAKRVLAYGRFAKMLENTNGPVNTLYTLLKHESSNLQILLEDMMLFIEKNPDATFENWKNDIDKKRNWRMEYLSKCSLLTEPLFNEFKNTTYDLKELRADLKTLKSDVNTISRVANIITLERY